MVMQLRPVHIKTREDPQKVAKFYIDNFGALFGSNRCCARSGSIRGRRRGLLR
jgi:hypothetical protein